MNVFFGGDFGYTDYGIQLMDIMGDPSFLPEGPDLLIFGGKISFLRILEIYESTSL